MRMFEGAISWPDMSEGSSIVSGGSSETGNGAMWNFLMETPQ